MFTEGPDGTLLRIRALAAGTSCALPQPVDRAVKKGLGGPEPFAAVGHGRTDEDRGEAADEPERDLEVGHVPHPAAEVDEVRDAAVPEERRDPVADHSAGEEPGADPRAGDSAD